MNAILKQISTSSSSPHPLLRHSTACRRWGAWVGWRGLAADFRNLAYISMNDATSSPRARGTNAAVGSLFLVVL